MGFPRLSDFEGLIEDANSSILRADIDVIRTGGDAAHTTLLTLVNLESIWMTGCHTSSIDLSASSSLMGVTSKNRNAFHDVKAILSSHVLLVAAVRDDAMRASATSPSSRPSARAHLGTCLCAIHSTNVAIEMHSTIQKEDRVHREAIS